MAIEEAEDTSENADLQLLVAQIFDIDEAKYVINKLYNMTLSQNHAVAQRDAKLKESEATLAEVNYYLIYWSTDRSLLIWLLEKIYASETNNFILQLQQENNVKGQLLDHVLHNEIPIFSKELITSISSTTNDTTSSNSSRSSSPVPLDMQ